MKNNILSGFADFALGALVALLAICSVFLYLLMYGYDPTKSKPKDKEPPPR